MLHVLDEEVSDVVHQDVQTAQVVNRGTDKALDVRFLRHVRAERGSLDVGIANRRHNFVRGRPAREVTDADIGPLRGKGEGDRPADPARPSRYESLVPREPRRHGDPRSEEHTSELQSLITISYAVFCLKKKKNQKSTSTTTTRTCDSKNK